MIDALGRPQSILLLGATSEIGGAVLDALVPARVERLVLAGRDPAALEEVAGRYRSATVRVETLAFDALEPDTHAAVVERAFEGGDVDVAVFAFGVLGDQEADAADPAAAARVVEANCTAVVSSGLAVAGRMRRQGHGALVLLSSVAGERPRRSNYIYGASKAGADAFFRGLAADLAGSGVRVVVVRPGFVRTRMTAALPPAPLATTADAVAGAVVRALEKGSSTVWVPGAMRWVMLALRLLPEGVFRRLPV